MSEPTPSNDYPMIQLIARRARTFAAIVGLALIVLGVLAVAEGSPWWVGIAFAGGGVVSYVLLRSYGELARILLDILLPQ